jgi:hypothetical protein
MEAGPDRLLPNRNVRHALIAYLIIAIYSASVSSLILSVCAQAGEVSQEPMPPAHAQLNRSRNLELYPIVCGEILPASG